MTSIRLHETISVRGRTVVLDEVHHRAEMSMQRSTAAWCSSSHLRNGAFPIISPDSLEKKCTTYIISPCKSISYGFLFLGWPLIIEPNLPSI